MSTCPAHIHERNLHLFDEPDCVYRELTRLRAIEDALPKTEDGVAIVPGMVVWYRIRSRLCSRTVGNNLAVVWTDGGETLIYKLCYSTEEAAREASRDNSEDAS